MYNLIIKNKRSPSDDSKNLILIKYDIFRIIFKLQFVDGTEGI